MMTRQLLGTTMKQTKREDETQESMNKQAEDNLSTRTTLNTPTVSDKNV